MIIEVGVDSSASMRLPVLKSPGFLFKNLLLSLPFSIYITAYSIWELPHVTDGLQKRTLRSSEETKCILTEVSSPSYLDKLWFRDTFLCFIIVISTNFLTSRVFTGFIYCRPISTPFMFTFGCWLFIISALKLFTSPGIFSSYPVFCVSTFIAWCKQSVTIAAISWLIYVANSILLRPTYILSG